LPDKIEINETLPSENKKISIERSIDGRRVCQKLFFDIPVMIEVAKCESRFRQTDGNGETLRGEKNILDRGVMQIKRILP